MTSPYLDKPRRELWKAQADTGRADYFRWTFRTGAGKEFVLSVGKAFDHASGPDTCEVLMWAKDKPRRELFPEDITCLLEPWQRYFGNDGTGPIAEHMPDSILTALLFGLGYWFKETEHKAITLGAA